MIDSSVVLKWVFDDEDYVPQARALRDACLIEGGVEFHAPALLPYELTHAIRNAAVNNRLPSGLAEEALAALLEVPIELHETDTLTTLGIALRMSISGYDARYVLLSGDLGLECWTSDERLVRASARTAPYVRSISEYPTP